MNITANWRPDYIIALTGFLFWALSDGAAQASVTVPEQTNLPGRCIPQFATPLPVFGPGPNAALPRVDARRHPALTVRMVETERQVLPQFVAPAGCPDVTIKPTRVWAYETSDWGTGKILGPAFWPAVSIEARRYIPTFVHYVNNLPRFGDPITVTVEGVPSATTATVQGLITVDQSVHWANPMGNSGAMKCMGSLGGECGLPYTGTPPAVVHLHGGEVPSQYDGGPEAWFTPDGLTGAAYKTLIPAGPGSAVYRYPNEQEPGTLWIHDHALGATRTNVYSGMAAFYLLRDPEVEPSNLPKGAYEIEMAIQDRMFDTESQLYFPDGSGASVNGDPPNRDMHPFWIPEFAGDVAVVNGSPWPFLKVEPRRYRFRIIGGSNARFYNLDFGAPTWVIGADDNYLNIPTPVKTVLLAPGERVDIIVDFTGKAGQSIVVGNDAPVPFPMGQSPVPVNGAAADQPEMAQIMRFDVRLPLVGRDKSCDPARPRLTGCARQENMVRLTDDGALKPKVVVSQIRQLVLKEVMGFAGDMEMGPLEVLENNTKYDGMMSPNIAKHFHTDGVSELPRVGSTEIWEFVNLTMDAHPMHTHLVQFQILNREALTTNPIPDLPSPYVQAWADAFKLPNEPNGAFKCGTVDPTDPTNPCPGFGPPNAYGALNADGALGGNPAIGPYLSGVKRPPAPEESGWKDTAKAYPGEVLRVAVRFAPTDISIGAARPGRNLFAFDPTKGPGYVWHCHIVDHEDNEMMRPFRVVR